MDIRYQVFVSSTFSDLEDERAEVIRTLLNMDCIPAGMELFPAADEEQFEYIKRVIDDCDYYLLIIAGRYGTLSPNGTSYAELEYDYAIEKGLKVIAIIHKSPEDIPAGKSDSSTELKDKLATFKEKVSDNRLVKYWLKKEELPGIVALSVQAAIKMYPSIGWVRSNRVSSEQSQERLLELEQENLRLREDLRKFDIDFLPEKERLSKDNELYEVRYSYELTFKDSSTKTRIDESIRMSWDEIFAAISSSLMQLSNNQTINRHLSNYIFRKASDHICEQHGENVTTDSVIVEDASISTILIQFRALGLITFDGSRWRLTEIGDRKLTELGTIKTETQNS